MLSYDICLRLKQAGFPQTLRDGVLFYDDSREHCMECGRPYDNGKYANRDTPKRYDEFSQENNIQGVVVICPMTADLASALGIQEGVLPDDETLVEEWLKRNELH